MKIIPRPELHNNRVPANHMILPRYVHMILTEISQYSEVKTIVNTKFYLNLTTLTCLKPGLHTVLQGWGKKVVFQK